MSTIYGHTFHFCPPKVAKSAFFRDLLPSRAHICCRHPSATDGTHPPGHSPVGVTVVLFRPTPFVLVGQIEQNPLACRRGDLHGVCCFYYNVYRSSNFSLSFTLSRGEGAPQGRVWNAGDNLKCGAAYRLADRLRIRRSDTAIASTHFRPHSTSVTAIAVTPSPREKVCVCGATAP